jgi:allophanate hydrolase subunit 2
MVIALFWIKHHRVAPPRKKCLSHQVNGRTIQGRPLKAGDYLPLGSVAANDAPKPGAEVPAAWRPTYPAAKVLPPHDSQHSLPRYIRPCPRNALLRCCKMRFSERMWTLAAHQVGEWTVGVLPGPNEAPDYFTEDDIKTLYSSSYSVHYNS